MSSPPENVTCWSWGRDHSGETGRNLKSNSAGLEPGKVFVNTGVPFNNIACGWNHTCGVNDKGQVYSWGCNEYGQLGRTGSAESYRTPHRVRGELAEDRIVTVACGSNCTAAVSEAGHVYTWGQNTLSDLPRRFPLHHPVVMIACGGGHMAAVSRSGELWTWGYNEQGQLGHGNRTEGQSKVRKVPVFGHADGDDSEAEHECAVVSVACGADHTVAIAGGDVYSWGDGRAGQLGHLTGSGEVRPRRISALEGRDATKVACGAHHTACIAEGGALYMWGHVGEGRLGLGKPRPSLEGLFGGTGAGGGAVGGEGLNNSGSMQRVPTLVIESGVDSVALGQAHTLVCLSKGRVYGFGYNSYGQVCGGGGKGPRSVWEPALCNKVMDTCVGAAAGGGQSIVLTMEGMLSQLCERTLVDVVDVDNAAELCMAAHRLHAPRLHAYVASFIRQHKGEVLASAGWQSLAPSHQKEVLANLSAQ